MPDGKTPVNDAIDQTDTSDKNKEYLKKNHGEIDPNAIPPNQTKGVC